MRLHPTKHAKKRQKRRGIPDEVIRNTIQHGRMVKLPGVVGKFKRTMQLGDVVVVLKQKKIITVYKRNK